MIFVAVRFAGKVIPACYHFASFWSTSLFPSLLGWALFTTHQVSWIGWCMVCLLSSFETCLETGQPASGKDHAVLYKKHRRASMRVTILLQGPEGHSQYDGQGVYCGLSTAFEVFLIFTTQLYWCLCNYNSIAFISWQDGSIATGILPTPNTSLSSLPVGSKCRFNGNENSNCKISIFSTWRSGACECVTVIDFDIFFFFFFFIIINHTSQHTSRSSIVSENTACQ